MPIGLQALEETCFTWSNPCRVSFQFNQEPSWLPIYIGTLPFPDLFRFAKSHTNPKHHRDWKTQTSSPKFGVGHAFFLLFHPRYSNLKNRSLHRPSTVSWAGEFFDRIAFFAVYRTTICKYTWMNVYPTIFSKTEPPPNISYSTKTQTLKKTFRINIITIISKPSINSSVNGFRQIS